MDLTILDTNFNAITVIDVYHSFIWTDRYYEYGDFELYTNMNKEILNYIKQDYYIQNPNSEHTMIIEKIQITSDFEEGDRITVSGRSLESILDRRIVWGALAFNHGLQFSIQALLEDSIINPSKPERKIENFIFEESTDPVITSLKLDAQYTGDNLYDVISKICIENNIGFKITLNDSNQFVFKLYAGVDRSYEQEAVPYVVFSSSFDNILNGNYIESKSALKNVTLIGGQGEGEGRVYMTVGNVSGLERRELFTDARDLEIEKIKVPITPNSWYMVERLDTEGYEKKLLQRGKEKLAECVDVVSFEGQVETTLMYKYGEDFFQGDIVQISDEYGHDTRVRILEVITSEDEEGILIYPTFATINEKEGE